MSALPLMRPLCHGAERGFGAQAPALQWAQGSVPDRGVAMWTSECVFYQIYPLGFCGAPRENDGVCVPRIRKVASWAPYLAEMGVGAVLLNPVFSSDAHGYDTRDLRRVDCRLGTNEDLAQVVRELHERKIRVVLDAVFNHVGRGFWAFEDVRAHGARSAYAGWFNLSFEGDSPYGDGFWYEGWEGHYELVKLNLENSEVIEYLLGCVRLWHDELGVDGLRLDVAYGLDRDFLRRLRAFCRALDPDLALVGEALHGDYNQLVNDDMLDSCTNYECYKGLWSSLNDCNMFEIAHSLHRQFGADPWCVYRGKHLLSFADNHDVTRLASILTDKGCIPVAYGALFGMPGIPCVYYGSEWGATGVKGRHDDFDLRPSFDEPVRNDLSGFVGRLMRLRAGQGCKDGLDKDASALVAHALSWGDYRNVVITNGQLLFGRAAVLGDRAARVLVALNCLGTPSALEAPELVGAFADVLDGGRAVELDGALGLGPHDVRYLLRA